MHLEIMLFKIAQLAEQWTKTPIVNVQSMQTLLLSCSSLTMFAVQPQCAITCINICVHVKKKKRQSYHCLDTQKSLTHWQEWVEKHTHTQNLKLHLTPKP